MVTPRYLAFKTFSSSLLWIEYVDVIGLVLFVIVKCLHFWGN